MLNSRSRRISRQIQQAVSEALEKRQLLASTPFTQNGAPWEITNTGTSWVEAENFDYGGNGHAYNTTATSNAGGQYRTAEDIGIEGPNAATGGTYNIGYVNSGQWMNYTIHVDTAGYYVIDDRTSNANLTAAVNTISFNNSGNIVNSGNISAGVTGGWQTYSDQLVTMNLSAGTQVMTLSDTMGGCNWDYISFTPQTLATSAEQAYNPTTVPDTAPPVFRGNPAIPTLVPQFGAATVRAAFFDFGGQATSGTGPETAGYFWHDARKYTATYPYTATAYRPNDSLDMTDSNGDVVLTNWAGGDWAQYTIVAGTNLPPTNPASTTPANQTYTTNLNYQFIITYSNSSATASTFQIQDTTLNPTTQLPTLSTLGSIQLPGTGGNYQTASISITLPQTGTNTLRLMDGDSTGTVRGINLDSFKLINSTTQGNGGAPWEITSNGATTHIPADDVDVTPGSTSYPVGTSPAVAPTSDTIGSGNDIQDLTTNDAVSYTISPDIASQYNMSLRVLNTGSTPATIQVTFDSGAAFGGATDNVVFGFNVPVSSSYQTITLATNTGQNPQTTNNYVEIQAGPQKMTVKVLGGTLNLHYVEISNITAQVAVKPDSRESGSYAYQVDDNALNTVSDLFDRVYNTNYKWINPPANAPVPTNDWWTNMLVSQFAGTMYAFPESLADAANGVTFSSYGSVGTNTAGNSIQNLGQESIILGASGTTFTNDALLDYGDWTVHYRMQTAGSGYMNVTMGRGMPYAWYEYNGLTPTITLHTGSDANQNAYTIYDPSGNVISGSYTGDHFRIDTGAEQLGVFAPAGTTFTRVNNLFTVTFAANVAHYLVTAVLPDSSNATLATFYSHAYSVPRQVGTTQSSTYSWAYSATAGTVTTIWNLNMVAIDPANPPSNYSTIQGWLPLDYTNGATGPTMLTNASSGTSFYPNLNGNIEMSAGSTFNIVQTSLGINFELALPQIINAPTQAYDASNASSTMVSTDYSPQQMLTYIKTYISQNTNAAATAAAGTTILNYGNDTYWGGKPMQEYAEFALMAKQIGDTSDYTILLNNLTTFMTDWFTYTPGESAHYFAYYPGTHSLTGFDPSYGSENFTDNMFHYGYFTAAAGVLAMLNPAWAAQYGSMAKMVAMQYANWLHPTDTPDLTDPNAESLPFLRTFEPWIGHSYAGGTSSGGGNNEESSSEAIQSWLGIALLGQALNDPSMTAAGMMGYTMESKAVQEQWFNQAPGATNTNGLGFPTSFKDSNSSTGFSNVAINFDNGKSYASYFGANPEYILGIESLPLWPSLDFLGENAAAAAAASQAMLQERIYFYANTSDGTYASFESGGENDWLNIALGFQAQYNPQATALQFARMISQQTPTGVTGSTGLYYFQDHSYQTYGLRNWTEHLSVPLGGVYSHGADSTTMSNTTTYMAYNPTNANETVYVYNSADQVIDSFTASPGFNTVTRSANGTQAPPIITTGAAASPSPITGKTGLLTVAAADSVQNPGNLTYTWSMVSGPNGAVPQFSPNGTNAAAASTVTFNLAGSYTFLVTATDVNGLSVTDLVAVTVQSTLTSVTVSPNPVNVFTNGTQVFTASGSDQFGTFISNPTVTWAVTSGGGSITTAGSYKAGASTGSVTITATSGSAVGLAAVTVVTQISAPTNLAASNQSTSSINLTWSASTGATGYYIYRGTSPGAESAVALNLTLVTGTTYTDTTASPYTTYFYTVKAVSSGGASSASNEASATTAIDLALNKTVTVSYTENGGDAGSNAVDGNDATRWSSYNGATGAVNDPGWIYVNLGAVYHVSEVKLNWEAAAGKNYEIDVSNDALNWTPIATITGNASGGWKDYPGLNGYGQYVRMYGTARVGNYGYSLWDLSVYGPPAPLNLTGPYYLKKDGTVAGQMDAWAGTTNTGNPTQVYQLSQITTITETSASSSDQFTADFSAGNPFNGATGVSFVGQPGGTNSLIIKGDNSGDTYQTGAGSISFGSVTMTFSNLASVNIQSGTGNDTYKQTAVPGANIIFNAGGGTDSVTLSANAGTMTLAAPSGRNAPLMSLSTLSIGAGSRVNFTSATGHTGHSVMQVSNYTLAGATGNWLGTLDLGNNDLVIASTTAFANVSDQINRGAIISSAAASDSTHLTTLGVMLNDDGTGHSYYSASLKYDGLIPSLDFTLVKYTYYGDTNLDGKVNSADYTLIDAGFLSHATGWHNGDLNHDGVINGSDYTLIDNAFNTQGTAIPAAQVFSQTAVVATTLASSAPDQKHRRQHRVWQDLI